jgi:hypothetical protein
MARGDMDTKLLLKIMQRVGEFREEYPRLLQTLDLVEMVPDVFQQKGHNGALCYLEKHAIYLRDEGYLHHRASLAGTGIMVLQLTPQGERFVQPELAEFGREPMLPQIVNQIENRIEISHQSSEEKAGQKFKLREALASGAVDLIAKVIVEAGSKMAGL